MAADVFAKKLPSNLLKAVQAARARLRSASTLNSMQYFRDFCRIFQYQPPALSLPCIEISQTSSGSEDVSLQKRHSLTVRTDRAVSCRHDNASKREIRGKHLQNLKMFSITRRSDDRNIEPKPFEHLAMRDSRRHPVHVIRLKPLLAVSGLANTFRY